MAIKFVLVKPQGGDKFHYLLSSSLSASWAPTNALVHISGKPQVFIMELSDFEDIWKKRVPSFFGTPLMESIEVSVYEARNLGEMFTKTVDLLE